jgi:hypothetical protein
MGTQVMFVLLTSLEGWLAFNAVGRDIALRPGPSWMFFRLRLIHHPQRHERHHILVIAGIKPLPDAGRLSIPDCSYIVDLERLLLVMALYTGLFTVRNRP